MSKEMNVRYNHIHSEATRALTNIQIFIEAAGMQIGLPATHKDGDLSRSMYTTSQPPETVEQIENPVTNTDDFMDTGGQLQTGMATANNLGSEIADNQVLELNVPQDDMDQICL
jgi:hypothetical protein